MKNVLQLVKFIRNKDLNKWKLLLHNFKVYKNAIHKLTRINNSDYYKRHIEEHKNNSRKPGMRLDLLPTLEQILINKLNICLKHLTTFVTIARDAMIVRSSSLIPITKIISKTLYLTHFF